MIGKLHIIGVGPGDPELMTLKGVRILKESLVYFVPKGKEDGSSTALAILQQVVETTGKEIIEIHFPMKKIKMGEEPDPLVKAAWLKTAKGVLSRLQQGKDVVFPTLGDPAIYSTGFYLCRTLLDLAPDLEINIVPGVSSIGACAAETGMPLCLGDDMLAVIPATFDDERLRNVLATFDSVVLMKVYRVMDRLIPLLREMGLLEKATLVEKIGHSSQRVIKNISQTSGMDLHYFATIIIRKF